MIAVHVSLFFPIKIRILGILWNWLDKMIPTHPQHAKLDKILRFYKSNKTLGQLEVKLKILTINISAKTLSNLAYALQRFPGRRRLKYKCGGTKH